MEQKAYLRAEGLCRIQDLKQLKESAISIYRTLSEEGWVDPDIKDFIISTVANETPYPQKIEYKTRKEVINELITVHAEMIHDDGETDLKELLMVGFEGYANMTKEQLEGEYEAQTGTKIKIELM